MHFLVEQTKAKTHPFFLTNTIYAAMHAYRHYLILVWRQVDDEWRVVQNDDDIQDLKKKGMGSYVK